MQPGNQGQQNSGMGDKAPAQPPPYIMAVFPVPADQITNFQNQMSSFNLMPFQMPGYPQMMQFPQQPSIIPPYPTPMQMFPPHSQTPFLNPPPNIPIPTTEKESPSVQVDRPSNVNHLKDSQDSSDKKGDIQKDSSALTIEPPRERWKRKDDKEMFAFLRTHCNKAGDTIENILQRLESSADKDQEFWVYISDSIKWKGPLFMLQKRFQKLCQTKGLSIREKILLRKLYDKKKKSKEEVTLDSILYHFPGRTLKDLQIENLDEEINSYFAAFKESNN
ncbi:unnamed protein product [Moneuplotes crassus]|uniref:Uncharacterized protein n=1 Tax=Euplotes crassus TaxID=5936 RepID=A0AAD1XRY8_EUPCR|nr:unnamed protein product [Moneuplotes crassus]